MRRLILLAALAAVAMPAAAAKRSTVEQLEQTLAAELDAHRTDAEVSRKVGEIELSERLTDSSLDRLASRLPLGPRTAFALQLLADQSAFLDPPASELPATEPPDAASQQHMLEMARSYVVQTWPRLPNFFATRTTHRFDDGAQILKQGDWPVRAGLHLAGTLSRQITFRDGKEAQDTTAETSAVADKPAEEIGLRSWGEFGPAPTVVLGDVANRKIAFSHWEKTPAGLAAVYRYEVPREASHYAVAFTYFSEQVIGRTQYGYSGRNRSAEQVANIPRARELKTFSETPGYHGAISIDPATGAVLRITIEAELSSGDPLLRAATLVEYGPVTIGDRKFICPMRSVAISLEQGGMGDSNATAENGAGNDSWQSPLSGKGSAPLLLINETSFSKYHRLGSTTRILTDASSIPGAANQAAATASTESSEPAPGSSQATGAQVSAADVAAQLAANASSATGPGGPESSASATASSEAASPTANPVPAAPPPAPVIPEITMNAANGVPDLPADAPRPEDSTVTLKLTSRLVDVGVVVYDKKGHPVSDLKREDFELYDNGRKQEIRFFSAFASETAPAAASASPSAANASSIANAPSAPASSAPTSGIPASDQSFSNRSADPAGSPASAAGPGATAAVILLIDESHIAWSDMSYARQQMLKFLKTVPATERVGLYTMTSLGFKVLKEITTDHAALIARLDKWMPTAQSVTQAQEEEMRNRQQFNEVNNVADLNSVNGNQADVADANQPVDPQLRTLGDNPARASLIIMGGVARHLSAVPGHKTLVWISSDNVFADWRDQQVGIDKSGKEVDRFALRAQEAMNDAHVAVYPFDVSQLEGAAISADIQHRNVELTQAAMDVASLAPGGSGVGRDMTAGRTTAEMHQDLHPIQEPIMQVAAATGGRTIRRAGDMAGELATVVQEGHASYQLSFSPDTIADNQYHNITVKLAGKHGLTARYRTGYLYAKEPATLKERFEQAVWRPMDVNEVSVTADVGVVNPGASESGANVKINVAAGDLGMQQQAGRWMDKLDIFFIQRDDAGIRAQVEGQTLGLRLRPSTYQNLLPTGVPFEHTVRLKPGTASLRVLVVDENSGRMGSVTIPASALGGGQ